MAVTPRPLLSARDLACRRGRRRVFSGLDFELAPGSALILRGANGSGKTSLLRLLAGLGRPVAGTLTWEGTPLADLGEFYRALVHYAGHSVGLKAPLSLEHNLLFWARYLGGDDGRVMPTLERFGLGPQALLPAGQLSAGQQKRGALARLLVAERPIWLLDEPTVALDSPSQARLFEIIADHLATGGIAVIATHMPLDVEARVLDLSASPPTAPNGPMPSMTGDAGPAPSC